ncbi:MAG: hypothetical protein DRJ11_04500 [Candidatus Aminicenantes bacterium]|nr:MAG: hypothetical protein DRJ11_04500 [Candidatus Aminicenantes bacterium]
MKFNNVKTFKNAFIFLMLTCLSFNLWGQKASEQWDKWLREVAPIMSAVERSIFNELSTEEDRRRFVEFFWKARDPKPETPQNEYKTEYYQRVAYAEKRLGGIDSDRGRIYALLGEPLEKHNYSGYEKVVDCELWIYHFEDRPGLPPFIYLIFYRRNNTGDYRLYYPGINSAVDLLSPGYKESLNARTLSISSFNELRKSFPQLAEASLSVIPGEKSSPLAPGTGSSGIIIANIFSLPDREVEKTYLRNFSALKGQVKVSLTTKSINGYGFIALSQARGFTFLNYSLLPEIIHTRRNAAGKNEAIISLMLIIEDSSGNIIYQKERNFTLEVNEERKKIFLDEKRLAFKDFAPIIEGNYLVRITFLNKTSEEVFVYETKINVKPEGPFLLLGHKLIKLTNEKFIPFRLGKYKILPEPRLIFNQQDVLKGIIKTSQEPVINLINVDNENIFIPITQMEKDPQGLIIFNLPLSQVKPGYYYLSASSGDQEFFRKIITVTSANIKKTIDLETSDLRGAEFNYYFILAQEYMNAGLLDKSIAFFEKLPPQLRNEVSLPLMAKAYYLKKDYAQVLNLLENSRVPKTYSVLALMANSALQLNQLEKAATYLERLRQYGDTVSLNQTLAATFLSLGNKEKAKIYYERAKQLRKSTKEKKE